MTILINQLIDLHQPSLYVALGSIVWVSSIARWAGGVPVGVRVGEVNGGPRGGPNRGSSGAD